MSKSKTVKTKGAKMKNEIPQVFKDFLRKRRKSNIPAHPEQVSKYVDPDEFYTAVVNDLDHKWTWYSVDGEYCKGDPRKAPCVHFQPEACSVSWGRAQTKRKINYFNPQNNVPRSDFSALCE